MIEGSFGPSRSSSVESGLWLRDRLAPFRDGTVASFVPAGYESYARLLHPVSTPQRNDRLVRWKEVAEWSGRELTPTSTFHSVAMGPGAPRNDRPWSGQGPDEGTLFVDDAAVLASTLRQFTPPSEQCWFGVWSGYGFLLQGNGPELELECRAYFLFSTPVERVATTVLNPREHRTPTLWWPERHSWFVASEIDLTSTYVGGPHALISELVNDSRIEAMEVAVSDTISPQPESWTLQVANEAACELITNGVCEFTTTLGTLSANLKKSWRRGRWGFHCHYEMLSSHGGSGTEIRASNGDDLHQRLAQLLALNAMQLAH